MRAESVRRLEVFDHLCLLSIARVGWSGRMGSVVVKNLIFGPVQGILS